MTKQEARAEVWWGGFVRGLPEQYQEPVANSETVPLTRNIYDAAVEAADRAVLIAGLDNPAA